VVTLDEFSRLVAGIYAAAVTPDRWETVVRDIHCTVGGTSGGLASGSGATWSIEDSTLPEESLVSYAEHYCRLDVVMAAVNSGPIGVVRTGPEVLRPARNTEIYNGWVRPNELGDDGLFVRVTGGAQPTSLIINSPMRTTDFASPERIKLVSSLIVHLQQALRTRDRLGALAQSNDNLLGALEVVRHGVVVVSHDGLVLNVNSAAEEILRAQDGIGVRSGCLVSATTGEERLGGAVHEAVTSDGEHVPCGRSFSCARPSGHRPYSIHVLPLSHVADGGSPGSGGALVLIIDPEREAEAAPVLLRRLFGLTTTEAEVAVRLARGADLRQISDDLGVLITTVRTHLQHVYEKTDTHRQAELVRLLLALTP
jgi:DNA-binding CsgD family transcriptional regulator